MSGTLSPVGRQYFTDSNGDPLSGGKVYTYQAGTSTPATTYSDVDLLVANANPIILDAAGRCVIYLASSSYKYVVYTSADSLIWSQDNIASVASQAVLGEVFSFGGDSATPVTGTTYPSGATYASLAAGTSILDEDATNLAGTYVMTGMLISPAGETITAAIVNLSDGSPDTPLGTISTTSTEGVPLASGVVTLGAAGSDKQYGIKIKVTGGTGFGWGFGLRRTG